MKTFIALIRGINVGGNNLLPMKDLISLMETNGYKNVRTYIQSGNVIFESEKAALANLGSLIEKKFGFQPEIIFLTKEELLNTFKRCPYLDAEGKNIHFFFCLSKPTLDIELIDQLKSSSENYFLNNQVFYLHAPDGIGRSKLAAKTERCLGVSSTARNLNTVNRLVEMAGT